MKTKIFLRNLSCIDHSYIDNEGLIHGGSYHISCTVEGKVDNAESVVVDFSKCKKQLKALVDDQESGVDHKLLIYNNSNCSCDELETHLYITSDYLTIDCPKNAVCKVDGNYSEYDSSGLAGFLEKYLTDGMQWLYPDAEINITVELNEEGFTDEGSRYFRYLHGLKDSSSWGCQNQNHGHLSFIEASHFGIDRLIADHFDDVILINRENVVEETVESIAIKYETSRGVFWSIYRRPHNWIVFDSETTIEYIMEYIRTTFDYQLSPGMWIRVSEGLAKGCEISL